MTLAIVDSGVANLTSVSTAIKRIGVDAEITSDPQKIRSATRVILPGVGTASSAIAQLQAKGLMDVLRSLTQPVLGICLGMQIMFDRTEESGGCAGLGVIPGTVKQMPSKPDQPIPHMGWNSISIRAPNHPLIKGIDDETYFYFVHSFAAFIGEPTLASCDYSETFTAVAAHNNFCGCQFHPERSSTAGRQILENFLKM